MMDEQQNDNTNNIDDDRYSSNRTPIDVTAAGTSNNNNNKKTSLSSYCKVLWWDCPNDFVPISCEEALIPFLVKYGSKERGMIKNQPSFRVQQIRNQVNKQKGKINLSQTLSLRRHHMKLLNPQLTMSQLRLGPDACIKKSADLFECAVEQFLIKCKIKFKTEQQQKEQQRKSSNSSNNNNNNNNKKKGDTSNGKDNDKQEEEKKDGDEEEEEQTTTILTGTPDFLLEQEVLLRKVRRKQQHSSDKNGRHHHQRRQQRGRGRGSSGDDSTTNNIVLEERKIYWIEAKMFYGASTIPHNTKGAVGGLLKTAKKYVDQFGEGAMVFMYGCGDQLASDLRSVGVSVLDCSTFGSNNPLKQVHDHQRTWCADEKGRILP